MLHELAYKGEIHSFDLLTMECVAHANSNISKSTPNETIAQMQLMFSEMQLPRKYGITREALKSLYDHSFDGDLDFAALSVCDTILNNGVILSHWGKAHVIKDETSSICAPIEIEGKRYYAVLISGRKKNGLQYPYAMRVFSDEYIRNELLEIYRTSPQNEIIPRQNADFQKFAANLLINYIIDNSDLSFLSNIEQNNNAEQDNSSIKTQDNNKENINCNRNMNQESEYHKSYNRGKKMIERYLRTLGKEQALSRIKNVLVQLTSDEQIAKSKYNKGQIDALTDYVYGLNEGKIRLTESLLRNVIRESINKILNESQELVCNSFEELFAQMQQLSDGASITKYKCEDMDDPEDATFKYELTDENGYLIMAYYE